MDRSTFLIGESLVGDGNEVAHIDLMIGHKSGPAGAAFAQRLAAQTAGHNALLAWPPMCRRSRTRSCSTR